MNILCVIHSQKGKEIDRNNRGCYLIENWADLHVNWDNASLNDVIIEYRRISDFYSRLQKLTHEMLAYILT